MERSKSQKFKVILEEIKKGNMELRGGFLRDIISKRWQKFISNHSFNELREFGNIVTKDLIEEETFKQFFEDFENMKLRQLIQSLDATNLGVKYGFLRFAIDIAIFQQILINKLVKEGYLLGKYHQEWSPLGEYLSDWTFILLRDARYSNGLDELPVELPDIFLHKIEMNNFKSWVEDKRRKKRLSKKNGETEVASEERLEELQDKGKQETITIERKSSSDLVKEEDESEGLNLCSDDKWENVSMNIFMNNDSCEFFITVKSSSMKETIPLSKVKPTLTPQYRCLLLILGLQKTQFFDLDYINHWSKELGFDNDYNKNHISRLRIRLQSITGIQDSPISNYDKKRKAWQVYVNLSLSKDLSDILLKKVPHPNDKDFKGDILLQEMNDAYWRSKGVDINRGQELPK